MVLSDLRMPGMSGYELQQTLQKEMQQNIPFMFMTADQDEDTESRGFENGAMDFIRKPFRPDVLLRRVGNIMQTVDQIEGLKKHASTDPLTGLLNKVSAEVELQRVCSQGQGALLMIDLDSFKLVNDIYGHAMGDKVLMSFADILRVSVRPGDVVGRLGGDEFIAFCSGMSDEPVYYFGRNRLTYNVLAVTAACLLMKKAIFTEVGGFNEDLAVAYNDIDLCMKVCEAGYYNAVRPDAVLVHHESASRGNDALSLPKMRRLMAEQEDLYRRHPAFDRQDPFYNPNLAQNRVDFTCRFDTSFDKETAFRKISSLPGREGRPELRYAVDCASAQRFVLIEGWAFIPGSSKNSRSSLKLILQGEEGIYLAETAPVYRPDLEKAFPDEMDVLYSGFHARFHRDEIPDGEYSITLLWNDSARVDTEARLIK